MALLWPTPEGLRLEGATLQYRPGGRPEVGRDEDGFGSILVLPMRLGNESLHSTHRLCRARAPTRAHTLAPCIGQDALAGMVVHPRTHRIREPCCAITAGDGGVIECNHTSPDRKRTLDDTAKRRMRRLRGKSNIRNMGIPSLWQRTW